MVGRGFAGLIAPHGIAECCGHLDPSVPGRDGYGELSRDRRCQRHPRVPDRAPDRPDRPQRCAEERLRRFLGDAEPSLLYWPHLPDCRRNPGGVRLWPEHAAATLSAGIRLCAGWPLVAIGLYELSRRHEQGLPTDWKYAFFMAWLFTA